MSNLDELKMYHIAVSTAVKGERVSLVNQIFVKFDDIAEFLKPSTNNARDEVCSHFDAKNGCVWQYHLMCGDKPCELKMRKLSPVA